MARIVGVDLPSNKRGEIALTYIYGIGRSSARAILSEAGIDYDLKVKDWNDDQLGAVRKIIGTEYKVEGELRIKRSDEHQTTDGYRLLPGIRHSFRTAGKRTEHEEQCPYVRVRRKLLLTRKSTK